MSVGNDVIDLNWNPKHGEAYFRKLRSYAFSPSELKMVTAYPTKAGSMILWSLKEAAYKSSIKEGNRNRFSPKDISILLIEKKSNVLCSTLIFRGHGLKGRTFVSDEIVHSITIGDEENFNHFISDVDGIDCDGYLEQSEKVRDLLMKELVNHHKGHITFSRNDWGIPAVLENGKSLKKDISFSHHGRVVGYAMNL